MWTATFRHRETTESCTHGQVSVTSFAGLQRTVCGACGHVSVGYLHDSLQDLAAQLPSTEARSQSTEG
jgi:hypothetical protein